MEAPFLHPLREGGPGIRTPGRLVQDQSILPLCQHTSLWCTASIFLNKTVAREWYLHIDFWFQSFSLADSGNFDSGFPLNQK